jgi:hypothetical protein
MRTQRRNKRPIYICQKYVDSNNNVKYHEPIRIMENYNSTTEEADIIAMGMDYPNRLRIKTDTKVFINGVCSNRKDLYHIGDRVYVFTTPPETHDPLCKNADYEVEIEPELGLTINQLDILLLRLSGKKNKNQS